MWAPPAAVRRQNGTARGRRGHALPGVPPTRSLEEPKLAAPDNSRLKWAANMRRREYRLLYFGLLLRFFMRDFGCTRPFLNLMPISGMRLLLRELPRPFARFGCNRPSPQRRTGRACPAYGRHPAVLWDGAPPCGAAACAVGVRATIPPANQATMRLLGYGGAPRQAGIVAVMCPTMSLVASVLFSVAMAGMPAAQLPAIWVWTVIKNFPMAFFWNMFAAAPFTHWLFNRLFPSPRGQ